jgi:aspartyl-tRNA(Asn)/glutamyl-tRNA(Gln) amidotransferase subunit C
VVVSEKDVRHVADLARLGLEPERIDVLVGELNGILKHMEVLQAVDPSRYASLGDSRLTALPLREDAGPQIPLARPRETFAPGMRAGFFLVPRLATHEDSDAESSP